MRFWNVLLLIVSIGSLAGCNEFVSTQQQVTALDVVGEPNDPVPDSKEPADILGSAIGFPDESESVTGSVTNDSSLTRIPLPKDDSEPVLAKPVSLKKTANAASDSPH